MSETRRTYVEELDVVEDVVVEGKVVAGDDIDTSVLLDLPVLQTKALGLLEEILTGELVSPVGLVGLLELTVTTHAGETEHGRLNHGGVCEGKMRKKKGVTISAAFEKFTERAIKAILFSQKEAQEHGKEVVLTQHLLLGLIAEEENSPDGFLSSGVTIEKAREAVRSIWDLRIPSFAPNDNNNTKVGDGDDKNDVTYHHVPFSIEVKRVFEAAAEYSKLLGYNFIGPEHLLVALFKVDDIYIYLYTYRSYHQRFKEFNLFPCGSPN